MSTISYINIGGPQASCFCASSIRLMEKLIEFPLLHDAVEEAVMSAKQEFFVAGILLFSQLLVEVCSEEEPEERNKVAHEFFKSPPTKEQYEKVRELFDSAAKKRYTHEKYRKGASVNFDQDLMNFWNDHFCKM
ncbi:hypothetical protein HYV70_05555 [Candidatus Uhrbacteria bacterium]|nr:hypothetical protein [Candidatus Uhrbacteria bacterium]